MSYQPPSDWTTWDFRSLVDRERPPPSVRNAVRFLWAGAAIEVLSMIGNLAAYQSAISQLYTVPAWSGQLHWAEGVVRVLIVVTSVARAGLWLWMASRNSAGRRWARILSTILFVINSLALLEALALRARADSHLLFAIASWLVGFCAIVLLWQRESSEFFTVRSRRYPPGS